MTDATENRAFLRRAVTWLAGEAGIRQFLDIGSGLPTMDNVHEVAQRADPDARIVYVDFDPVVIAHARALMANDRPGWEHTVHAVEGNLLDPASIIGRARQLLDFTQPVAVLLVAILHFADDAADPWGIVKTLMGEVPPGSYLAVSHATPDNFTGPDVAGVQDALHQVYAPTESGGVVARPRPAVARFFDGLELTGPGLVDIAAWRPARAGVVTHFYGGVAVKP
jgi:hypothetical protein